MKKLSLVLLMLLVLPTSASALEFGGRDAYSVERGQTVTGDLYIAGRTLSIDGTVTGDVMAAGGEVSVTGVITQDLNAVGGTVNVIGAIRDDMRVAGGAIKISGVVNGDVIIFGGSVDILNDARIGGDVLVFGGQAAIDGAVEGNVRFTGGNVTVGDRASIGGNLTYTSDHKATIASSALIRGAVSQHETKFDRQAFRDFSRRVSRAIIGLKFIMMLIAGLVLVGLFHKTIRTLLEPVFVSFGPTLLRGTLVAIILPLAIMLVFMTIFGIPLAVISFLVYVTWLMVSSILSPIIFGSWLMKNIGKQSTYEVGWKEVVVGSIAFLLIFHVPLVGSLLHLVLVLAAFGAISLMWWNRVWKTR